LRSNLEKALLEDLKRIETLKQSSGITQTDIEKETERALRAELDKDAELARQIEGPDSPRASQNAQYLRERQQLLQRYGAAIP
jgi:hypothetical protein